MEAVRTSRRVPAAVAVLAVALAGCSSGPARVPEQPSPSPSAGTAPASPSASTALPSPDCAGSVRDGPLPTWARGGFTGDGSSFRHVEGWGGLVVGVVFGDPLTSPPRPDRANKILWVARQPTSGRLSIDAQRDGRGPVVRREVGFGGGQSVVDLPRPGCWRMTLRWGELTDTVDLPYVAGG